MKKPKPKYTEEFMRFWYRYPKQLYRNSGKWLRPDKAGAFKEWELLDDEDKAHAMYSVEFYRALKTEAFTWHARRWLFGRRFDDWDMPEPEGEHLPEKLTDVFKQVPSGPDKNDTIRRQRKGLLN